MKHHRPLLTLILLTPVLSSCAIAFGPGRPPRLPRHAVVASELSGGNCSRAHLSDEFRMPLALAEEDPALREELDEIPAEIRRTVLAAGLEPVLARMLHERHAGGTADAAFVSRRQAVSMHLASLSSQLDAAVHMGDCLGDSAESIRTSMEHESDRREIRRTVTSLVIGAAVAIAAGVWELTDRHDNARVGFAIGGGAAAAGVGFAAFVPYRAPVVLDHPRNLLAPVFYGEDPDHLLPTFVFRMLTLPVASGSTPRETLVQGFAAILDRTVAAADRPRAEQLMFGAGGVYSPALVHAREQMLDQVESALSALVRDLEFLQRWLGRAFDEGILLESQAD